MSLFLKKSEIETNDGLIFDNIKKNSTFLLGNFDIDITSFKRNTTINNQFLLTLSLYSSIYKNMVTRDYQTITELFANIVGLLNFLFFIGMLMSSFENKFNVMKELMRKLFVFPHQSLKRVPLRQKFDLNKIDQESQSASKKSHFFTMWRRFIMIFKRLFISIKNKFFSSSLKKKQKKEFEDYKKMKKNKKLKFSFLNYIKFCLKGNVFELNKKEKLFESASNKIKKKLCLVNILQKLQDIDKLKKILLSKEEIFCFNLLSKPIIQIEGSRGSDFLNDRISPLKLSTSEMKDNYHKVLSSKSIIGERIIKMLDDDLKSMMINSKDTSK